MPPRVYVHIGLQKTGTSYLQSILRESREALRAQGLAVLPERGAFELMLAVREKLDPAVDPPWAFGVVESLRRSVAELDVPTALVTQETLSVATGRQIPTLLDALGAAETHLVVTVRDLARVIPSLWQQRTKAGRDQDLATFLDDVEHRRRPARTFWNAQDVPAILTRWQAHVPPERIHVVTVPPPDAPRELLLERFSSVIGLDDQSALSSGARRSNASLGLPQTELVRRVGRRLDLHRTAHGRDLKHYFSRSVLAPQPGVVARTPAAMESWCRSVSAEHIDFLRGGGYDIVGDLEELIPQPGSFTNEPQEVSDQDLLDSAVAALATMLQERAEMVAEMGALRRRARQAQQDRQDRAEKPRPRSGLIGLLGGRR